MGWNAIKTVAGAVAILTSVGVGVGIAPAHADEQSYFYALRRAGIDQYITPDTALQLGRWFCQQIGSGRSTQAVYSDMMDLRLVPTHGPVGRVMGAAVEHLCPDQKPRFNGVDDFEYIPVGQR